MGKALEFIMARRISQAAEANGLLLNGQFGNRPRRSTEVAARFITQAVRTAWHYGGRASLLQLDLAGAFDTVHHGALLATLQRLGFGNNLTQWLAAMLTDRKSTLIVDGVAVGPFPINSGIPQGSPLSPILFILYTTTLYARIQSIPGQLTIGFADDTNILAFAKTEAECVTTLERAFTQAHDWAETRGMTFAASKSELIHFKRKGPPSSTVVRLGETEIRPQDGARFLGIWLDRRLHFGAHVKAVKGKMETQLNALTRLAALTWGCTVARAREIYTKVIRNALTYGAGVFHDSRAPKVAKAFAPTQNKALRKVLGAYKATPIRHLETEAYCPPLDLYCNKRLADFEMRLQRTGMAAKLAATSARIAARVRNRRGRQRRDFPAQGHWPWARQWVRAERAEQEDFRTTERLWDTSDGVIRDWGARLRIGNTRDNGGNRASGGRPPLTAACEISEGTLNGSHLRLYGSLSKAHASALCQARTGKIGLRRFLAAMRVPNVSSPMCQCGEGQQDVEHLFIECLHPQSAELRAMRFPTPAVVRASLGDAAQARAMAKALTRSGWLREYRVFEELRKRTGSEADAGDCRPLPYRDKSDRPRARTRRIGI